MGNRMYCHQWHPGSDQDADRWCEWYHRPLLPKAIANNQPNTNMPGGIETTPVGEYPTDGKRDS